MYALSFVIALATYIMGNRTAVCNRQPLELWNAWLRAYNKHNPDFILFFNSKIQVTFPSGNAFNMSIVYKPEYDGVVLPQHNGQH